MVKPKQQHDEDEWEDEGHYGAMREALHEHIAKFTEEHDLTHGTVAMMLVDIAVSTRMIDYITCADEPSGAGLKVELNACRRDFEEVVGRAKKRADEFIAMAERVRAGDQIREKP